MFSEIVCCTKYHRGGATSKLTAGSNTDTPKNCITTVGYDKMLSYASCHASVVPGPKYPHIWTIKGSLLLSVPIVKRFSAENFLSHQNGSQKWRFFAKIGV